MSMADANASKFYYHFFYKSVVVTSFLVLLPLLSEFINQNLHNTTTTLEVLQLIFVGIAVSYGLFSNRTCQQQTHKSDNAQSHVSGLLQVSSVFDYHDSETENEFPSAFNDNKFHTWNSQYSRGEPSVVIAKHTSLHEHTTITSKIPEKPLLLPVRSLKSRVSEPEILKTPKEFTASIPGSLSRTSSVSGNFTNNGAFASVSSEENGIHRLGSKRFSGNTNKSGNEEFGGLTPLNLEEEVEEIIVHRSPIPWRSRSGRMEMKEDVYGPPLMENPESSRLQSRSFMALSSKSSRADSNSPLPMNLSPSPSLSSAKKLSPSPSWSSKSIEDVVRKKSFHRSSPPPPPPPPPPPFLHKSKLMNSSSSVSNDEVTPLQEMRRSIRSVPMEYSDSETTEPPRRAQLGSELRAGAQDDALFMGKSVRKIRPPEANEFDQYCSSRKLGENNACFIDRKENTEKRSFTDIPEEEKLEHMEKVVVETDDNDDTETEESEDDYFEEEVPTSKQEVVGSSKEEGASESVSDGGPDVDKKADEFIAKFREQIRLQRIESIRRSTKQQHVRTHSR